MPLNPPQEYLKVRNIHRQGLAADRPAATDVVEGTLYFSTDTLVLERSNGAVWSTYSPAGGGAPGAQGVPGPPGMQGEQGDDGEYFLIPGPAGNAGATGSTGAPGVAGPMGMPGFDGLDGEDSLIPGPQGIQGIQGVAGATGPAGSQGPIGIPGLDAEEPEYPYIIPGPQGAAGAAGSAGGVSGTYLQSSFTVATANWRLHIKRLQLASSDRATIQGTGRLSIIN